MTATPLTVVLGEIAAGALDGLTGAIPLDETLLRRFVARAGSPDECRAVARLLVTNAVWRSRYVELIHAAADEPPAEGLVPLPGTPTDRLP